MSVLSARNCTALTQSHSVSVAAHGQHEIIFIFIYIIHKPRIQVLPRRKAHLTDVINKQIQLKACLFAYFRRFNPVVHIIYAQIIRAYVPHRAVRGAHLCPAAKLLQHLHLNALCHSAYFR